MIGNHLAGMVDSLFTGGRWGSMLGLVGGAIIGLMSGGAVPGNEFYAALTGGVMGGMVGATGGAVLGAASGLVFGSGDVPHEVKPQQSSYVRAPEPGVTPPLEPYVPTPGKFAAMIEAERDNQEIGRG